MNKFTLLVFMAFAPRRFCWTSCKPRRLSFALPSKVDDTVFALATGSTAAAGIAVVRISGAESYIPLSALLGSGSSISSEKGGHSLPRPQKPPKPRRAALRRLYDPRTGDLLDEALVLSFPGPNSFTGEDVVELHLHGSRAVISGVLRALNDLGGTSDAGRPAVLALGSGQSLRLRPADRGEFTQRAFSNGRLGLTEVEGLADLLAADTSVQRRQALRQMGGACERQFNAWRAMLQKFLAHAEAAIDFGDDDEEEDVHADAVFSGLLPEVQKLRAEIAAHLMSGTCGEVRSPGDRGAFRHSRSLSAPADYLM